MGITATLWLACSGVPLPAGSADTAEATWWPSQPKP